MKSYPRTMPRRRAARVPAFLPVPVRARADGWTPLRQATFLVALARTRSVSAAARRAGMARETAYRLRRRAGAESFAAAWDHLLGRGGGGRRKVTPAELAARAFAGLVRPVVHAGDCAALAAKPDNTSLLRFLAQLDRSGAGGGDGGGRSQGFTARSVSTSAGLAGTRPHSNLPHPNHPSIIPFPDSHLRL